MKWYFGFLLLSIAVYESLFRFNFVKRDNLLVEGQLFQLNGEKKIIHQATLVNFKFNIAAEIILKERNSFDFYHENEKVFSISTYKKKDDYFYRIDPEFLRNPRETDSFLETFCDSGNSCHITFAFLKDEPKTEKLIDKIKTIKLNGKKLNFEKISYDYGSEGIGAIQNDIKNFTYSFSKDLIRACAKFDHFYFDETLRITTVTKELEMHQIVEEKYYSSEECISLKDNFDKYKSISILHWKGDWNKGFFREYSIQLK